MLAPGQQMFATMGSMATSDDGDEVSGPGRSAEGVSVLCICQRTLQFLMHGVCGAAAACMLGRGPRRSLSHQNLTQRTQMLRHITCTPSLLLQGLIYYKKPFEFLNLGTLAYIGDNEALTEILGFKLSGGLAYLIWK